MEESAYFHPYEGDASGQNTTSSNSVGTTRQCLYHHARFSSDFSYNHALHYHMMEEEEEKPMEILY